MEKPNAMNLDFSTSPNVWKFLQDNSFVRGLMGPVGSGKSYACCAEIFKRAVQQKPSPKDGIRYSRFAVVRNSYPMLKTTTIKTWLELFPENVWGNLHWSPPITHHLKLPARGDASGIDCEVIFLALDQPKDVRKLLSLELTGAWVNEARELPVAVIQGLTHRVGRYPSMADGGTSWRGIWLDTNPMDSDHWYYRLAEKETPKGEFAWKFFKQPGGVVEVKTEDVPAEIPEAQGYISAGSRWFKENPKAENIHNLPKGYYQSLLGGKNLDWVRCYAEGKYTYVQEGKAVWEEYDDSTMSAELTPVENVPIQVGLDFGLTPSAVFAQRLPNGAWHVLHEVVTFSMGLDRFVNVLKSEMQQRFPNFEFMVWGDPAGGARDQHYEVTSFEFLKTHGIYARPTPTNDFRVRREAVAMPMNRLVQGKPGFLVNKKCLRLRKSLGGGYHYTRVAIGAGQERFKDKPNKNEHSHVGDALGYCLLGGGEMKRMTRGTTRNVQPVIANQEFNVFA